jgi:6-phosphogluconolactonase (cycloisomerase 2 family)
LLASVRGVYRSSAVKLRLAILLAPVLLSACGGGQSAGAPSSVFPTPMVRFIYATNAGTNAVFLFNGNRGGNAAPAQTLTGSQTQLDNPAGLAFSSAGVLYVANHSTNGNGAITVYPGFTGGNIAPTFFIRGNVTQLSDPSMITLDRNGTVYVTNPSTNRVVAFANGANTNVYPSLWIQGNVTNLSQPNGIAVDGAGNIFVANTGNNTVTAYAPVTTTTVPANEAPFITISGSNTKLNAPFGLTFDSQGRLWVGNQGNNTIEVFPAGAAGNVAPTFTYSGASTQLNKPQQISFDSFQQLDVANLDSGSGSIEVFGVLPFPLPGTGNVSPSLFVTGAATQLTGAVGVTAASQ